MKKRDWLLLAGLVIIAAGALLYYGLTSNKQQAKAELAVYVNGQLYTVSPLINGQNITVEQADGKVNVIHMTEDGFYMESSTCENQDCIYQGQVTRDNWQRRILSTHVICLPNRVDVMLLVEPTENDVPDV